MKHVKKCRQQVCPNAAFQAQLQSWYFTLNKDSLGGVTESVHDIQLTRVDTDELYGEDDY